MALQLLAEPFLAADVIRPSPEVRHADFFGMILGALLLGCGVYVYDSMQTSSVANGEVATANRTIVNWDVAKADWNALQDRAHKGWVRISSK